MSTSVPLPTGFNMPIIGLGTWQSPEDEVESAVTAALECGYKHIDTAFAYYNEEAIGRSLKKWFDEGNDREELFITTKLPLFGNRAADVETYLNLSLERLGVDYVDMYLIHTPFGLMKAENNTHFWATEDDGSVILDISTDHIAMWQQMETQAEEGKARSVGLSNFNEAQITKIIDNSVIKPSNLQIEIHAYLQQRPLREYCTQHEIVVTAYSPLGSPGTTPAYKTDSSLVLPSLLENPVVQQIAETYGKTTAQVLLRHQMQGGLVTIPKSTSPERIRQNFDIFDFELTDEEIQELDGLDEGDAGRIFDFRSVFKGSLDTHPEYPF